MRMLLGVIIFSLWYCLDDVRFSARYAYELERCLWWQKIRKCGKRLLVCYGWYGRLETKLFTEMIFCVYRSSNICFFFGFGWTPSCL